MKIQTINPIYYSKIQPTYSQKLAQRENYSSAERLPVGYYYPANITFGLANTKHIKTLFSYGLPCMYTGIEMIDPKRIKGLIKNKTLNSSAVNVIKAIKPFEQSFR